MRHRALLAWLLATSSLARADVSAPGASAGGTVEVRDVPAKGALRYVVSFHARSYMGCGQGGTAADRRGDVEIVTSDDNDVRLTVAERTVRDSWSRTGPSGESRRQPSHDEQSSSEQWRGRARRGAHRLAIDLEGGLRLDCAPAPVTVDGAWLRLLVCQASAARDARLGQQRLAHLRDLLLERRCERGDVGDGACQDRLPLGARAGVRVDRENYAPAVVTRRAPPG